MKTLSLFVFAMCMGVTSIFMWAIPLQYSYNWFVVPNWEVKFLTYPQSISIVFPLYLIKGLFTVLPKDKKDTETQINEVIAHSIIVPAFMLILAGIIKLFI